MTKKIKIGIIDDDSSKVTQIMTQLLYGMKDASQYKIEKYYSVNFEPYEIPLKSTMEETIEFIQENRIDGVLIDYNLSSYATVSYTGVQLAKFIEQVFMDFPVFILTSYEDELYEQEIFNSYQVFDFARYLSEPDERIELNYKLIEQVLKHEKQIEQWKNEVEKLLPSKGTSAEIDEKLLDLDDKLERSINGQAALSKNIKRELESSKVDMLIGKIDELLKEE